MKSIFTYLLFFLLASTSLNVFAQNESVKELSPKQFNRVLKLNPNAVLIDIRTKEDFKLAHIESARLAPSSKELFHLIDSLGSSKDYLLYCKYGERSIDAGKMIFDKYKIKICSLEGGLEYWLKSGLGLE